MSGPPLDTLRLEGLRIGFPGGSVPVDGLSLTLEPGRCLALLGESGCGKSLTALAMMRLLPPGARVLGGTARLDGTDLFALPERAMQGIRGGRLAMIFQEPMTSLNPVLSVAAQIEECLRAHGRPGGSGAVADLIEAVGLPRERADAYPFQLSGGQRQRALIAMMLAADPAYLIADEPTTALDVTVQAQILDLLSHLQRERHMGLLLITHDIGVAAQMADRIAVAYAGQIVETAPTAALLHAPRHPYTQALLRLQPGFAARASTLRVIPGTVPCPEAWPPGCRFAARCARVQPSCRTQAPALVEQGERACRCHFPGQESWTEAPEPLAPAAPQLREIVLEARDIGVRFPIRRGLLRRTVAHVVAVEGVSLQLVAGEILALVGESGCGKTTLARTLLQLQAQTAGTLILQGQPLDGRCATDLRRLRRAVQIVFQDPYASLDPRMRIGDILEEGLLSLRPDLDAGSRRERIRTLMGQVGLDEGALARYPHAFSGGQRQRIAIARALAVEPKVLICDEPTSALDVSVQAQIINLLKELQRKHDLACLLISHNLPVVGYLADRVAVMRQGRIIESGPAGQVLSNPQHPYTKTLLAAVPGKRF